ncbi:MAG: DinB family protein [Candidatus Pristimantibacillus sp.]
MINKPTNEEYGLHFKPYIDLIAEGDVTQLLVDQADELAAVLLDCTAQQADYRYAEGKWSLKEVLGHIIDTERIMSYRLLRIARGDKTPLAGFDENTFVQNASFELRSLSNLLEEYLAVRRSTITLFGGVTEEAWARIGVSNDFEMSARALAYIIAGHERHHMNIIKDKYLV